MIAKLAYLTSPAPNVYMLNVQTSKGVNFVVEISEAHLANIVVDGASFALRKSRVPERVEDLKSRSANAVAILSFRTRLESC